MKKLYLLKCIFIITVYSFFNTSVSPANWIKSEGKTSTQHTQHTQHSNSDSLPAGVTQDWLNKLTDERGNRIFPEEEEPVTDALQQNTFDGAAIGVNYAKSVSSAGDVNGDGFDDVIIGDPNGNNGGGTNSGRAYIYFGGTIINSSADVILAGETVNNYFGTSVSSAGDVNSDGYDDVIVGATGVNSFTGRSYIYYGGASMNSISDVIMTGESTSDNFGRSVSTAGDLNADGFSDVLVGANTFDDYTGKAYIYFGGSSMNNTADVIMTGENFNDDFGYSVSDAGDVNGDGYKDVIIGANGFNSGFGRTYIYYGGVSMDNTADVIMTGGGLGDFFGVSASNAGDVNDDGYSDVIIGSYGYSSSTGRAYIFYGGASMNNTADVIMTGESANNLFGYSVSEAGDVNGDGFADVYVGAYGFATSKGRAYLYYGGASMNNAADIFMTGEETFNYFGYSVSGGGDVNSDGYADVIAGAYGYKSNTGRAYVYTNTMTGIDIPDVKMSGENASEFGYSVSDAGDVNHDGYGDVIIGTLMSSTNTGKAYLFYGSVTMDSIADLTMTGETAGSRFGKSVSSAGDVNSDGYDDVIVGADGHNIYTGRAYIYFGGASMDNIADVTMSGESINYSFGYSVSSAGDVNNDGYSDVIIGSDRISEAAQGRAYIFYGGSSMNNVSDVILADVALNNRFGLSVSSAGDVNSDGYSDVIVGAPAYSANTGRAYIYFGGLNMNTLADVIMTGAAAGNNFGASVSSAGDVNDDGYSDVIAGAHGYNSLTGRAYVFFGGSQMNNSADVTMTGEFASNWFGNSVSTAGDVNGDGYSDVTVSAFGYSGEKGRVYIFFGGAFMNNTADITMTGETAGDRFGSSVSSAGDINGDGYSDVIVGANYYYSHSGRSYIYLSSPPDNRKHLLLFGAIQGMYDPVLDTEVPDTVKVYLRNSTSPFARVDSSKNTLLGPLAGQYFLFRNIQNDRPYYIEVTHRNALTTWSADPVTFVNSDASIAFSVNSIYAYGDNEVQVDNSPYDVFAFYSGDVNQDGAIDLSDVLSIFNDANSFTSGYIATDLTGNDAVDLSDVLLAYNNSVGFVSVVKP